MMELNTLKNSVLLDDLMVRWSEFKVLAYGVSAKTTIVKMPKESIPPTS
jgi:hypothetical protein